MLSRSMASMLVLTLALPVQAQQRTQHAVVQTGLFSRRTCQPQQQYQAPPINISVPPAVQAGPDPTTIGMLGQIMGNQNQMMYQLGRIQGQQIANPSNPAPIIVNPPVPPVAIPQPQPTPIVYAPQALPQGYAPLPLPQQYMPQPLPQQYMPQPLPQGYTPQTLPHNYNPQIIVQPGGGTNPAPQVLPPNLDPQVLPPGFSPAPRSGPPGGQPPGIDFRFYQQSRNGSTQPPAAQPQVYSRQRQEREVRQ